MTITLTWAGSGAGSSSHSQVAGDVQRDLQTLAAERSPSPMSLAGMAEMAAVPGARSHRCQDVFLGETQPLLSCRQGQGVEAKGFSLLHYYTQGFSAVVFVYSPPSKGGDAPSMERGWEGDTKLSRWLEHLHSPSLCCVIPGTFFTMVPSAHLWSAYNSSQPQA